VGGRHKEEVESQKSESVFSVQFERVEDFRNKKNMWEKIMIEGIFV